MLLPSIDLQAPPLIVPRFIFELGPQELLSALENHAPVTDMIVDEVNKQGLDGIVSTSSTFSLAVILVQRG
jgi:hypothetical protein